MFQGLQWANLAYSFKCKTSLLVQKDACQSIFCQKYYIHTDCIKKYYCINFMAIIILTSTKELNLVSCAVNPYMHNKATIKIDVYFISFLVEN